MQQGNGEYSSAEYISVDWQGHHENDPSIAINLIWDKILWQIVISGDINHQNIESWIHKSFVADDTIIYFLGDGICVVYCNDVVLILSNRNHFLWYHGSNRHCSVIIMGAMHLMSPVWRLFTQSSIQAQIKENIKAPRHWPLCGEFTGDRWIQRINGHLRGKCFHLMTSLWASKSGMNYLWLNCPLWVTNPKSQCHSYWIYKSVSWYVRCKMRHDHFSEWKHANSEHKIT